MKDDEWIQKMLAANEDPEDQKLVQYKEHTNLKGKDHFLVKVPVPSTKWLCDKGNKGQGLCYSGKITLEESIEYSRYDCIFNDPPCFFRLCESCGIVYGKRQHIVDILHVKRPPNMKLWSVFFDSDKNQMNQKAVPFQKSSWAPHTSFSSNEINALNFAKAIPLDCKFMVIIGGTSSTVFPD